MYTFLKTTFFFFNRVAITWVIFFFFSPSINYNAFAFIYSMYLISLSFHIGWFRNIKLKFMWCLCYLMLMLSLSLSLSLSLCHFLRYKIKFVSIHRRNNCKYFSFPIYYLMIFVVPSLIPSSFFYFLHVGLKIF